MGARQCRDPGSGARRDDRLQYEEPQSRERRANGLLSALLAEGDSRARRTRSRGNGASSGCSATTPIWRASPRAWGARGSFPQCPEALSVRRGAASRDRRRPGPQSRGWLLERRDRCHRRARPPLLKERTDRRVTTGREAQVCLSHTVAVALLFGRAGVAEYTDALVNDPAVCAMGNRVAIEVETAFPSKPQVSSCTRRTVAAARPTCRMPGAAWPSP